MNDLITWLRAQLDEEAEDAQALAESFSAGGSWTATRDEIPGVAVAHTGSHIAHIARWDPARVLAEVDAKRRILDEYEKAFDRRKQHPEDMASAGALLTMLLVIKVLALPYADRDGYLDEWRP